LSREDPVEGYSGRCTLAFLRFGCKNHSTCNAIWLKYTFQTGKDEEFKASEDESDDEETIDEQEKKEKANHKEEIDELKAEGKHLEYYMLVACNEIFGGMEL